MYFNTLHRQDLIKKDNSLLVIFKYKRMRDQSVQIYNNEGEHTARQQRKFIQSSELIPLKKYLIFKF